MWRILFPVFLRGLPGNAVRVRTCARLLPLLKARRSNKRGATGCLSDQYSTQRVVGYIRHKTSLQPATASRVALYLELGGLVVEPPPETRSSRFFPRSLIRAFRSRWYRALSPFFADIGITSAALYTRNPARRDSPIDFLLGRCGFSCPGHRASNWCTPRSQFHALLRKDEALRGFSGKS